MLNEHIMHRLLRTPANELPRHVTPGLIADMATDWLEMELKIKSLERQLLDEKKEP